MKNSTALRHLFTDGLVAVLLISLPLASCRQTDSAPPPLTPVTTLGSELGQCGPFASSSLRELHGLRTLDLAFEEGLRGLLPVAAVHGPGVAIRAAATVEDLSPGIVQVPLFGAHQARFSAEDLAPLRDLEIDAISLGQDWLRIKWSGIGPASDERAEAWCLDPFTGSGGSAGSSVAGDGSERPTPSWAFLAWHDGGDRGATGPLKAVFWGDPTGIEEFLAGDVQTFSGDGTATLQYVSLGDLPGHRVVEGFDVSSWHLVQSFPAADSPEVRSPLNRRVPPPLDIGAGFEGRHSAREPALRVYFSVPGEGPSLDRIADRLDMRGLGGKEWRSGATIFSISAYSTIEGKLEWSPIRAEFIPGRVADPHFGFALSDDIDGLAVDCWNNVVVASLTGSSDTDRDAERGSGFYAWRMLPEGAKECPGSKESMPSPLYHWSGDRLDEEIARFAGARPVSARASQERPRPIAPKTSCGDDPFSRVMFQAPPTRGQAR